MDFLRFIYSRLFFYYIQLKAQFIDGVDIMMQRVKKTLSYADALLNYVRLC